MGQIKKQRKKYNTPTHPWQAERLKEESVFVTNYGFKNKKEIWKVMAKLDNYKNQVKKIIASKGAVQMEKEKEQLMNKLLRYGLIKKDSKIEDVLDLSSNSLMDRRLQTVVYKKNLARSLKQSRQFIVHGHVTVNGKKLTVPSYLVDVKEESNIQLNDTIPKEVIIDKTSTKNSEEKPAEEKPAEEKPAEEKPAEEKVPTARELKERKEEASA